VATTVDDQIQVKVNGLGYDNQNVILDRACLAVLNYPVAMYVAGDITSTTSCLTNFLNQAV
jgi:hypothetical protein